MASTAGHSSTPVTRASMYSRMPARSIAGAHGSVQPFRAPASIAPSSLPHSGFPDCRAAVVLVQVVCAPAPPVGVPQLSCAPRMATSGLEVYSPPVAAGAVTRDDLDAGVAGVVQRGAQAVVPGGAAAVVALVPAAEVADRQAVLSGAAQPVQQVADVGAGEQ